MHPTRWLAVRLGRQPWLPQHLPRIVATDKTLRRLTRGRVTLLGFAGLPELFLIVPGRKSGIARTTPLLTVPHDGGWLIAGSNWGGPTQPVWVTNLRAAEAPTIEIKGRRIEVDARELSGAEREEAWRTLVATWPNYEVYAERTERLIPVFRLTPR